MATLHQDLKLISATILLGHPVAPVSLSHITKEVASLLLDQPLPYNSTLERRYTIHGVETISVSEILQRASPIDGNISKIAQQMGYFKVISQANRKNVVSLLNQVDITHLVTDPYLYSAEARLLGKLSLRDKIILAGHRTEKMTLDSYWSVVNLLANALRRTKKAINNHDSVELKISVNKACECARELVLKSEHYPELVSKVKVKLEAYPSIAAALLASTLEENQKIDEKDVARAKILERGTHLLRSILTKLGTYSSSPSINYEIEDNRFKNVCKFENFGTPSGNLVTNPCILIDFMLDLIMFEHYWVVVPLEQNA